MARATISNDLSGKTSNILDLFEKLPQPLKEKIVGAGIIAVIQNFNQKEKFEIFSFLRSNQNQR